MRLRSSPQQGKDFDAQFSEVCESTMREMLGEGGMKSVAWWLGKSGVSFSDCSRRPQDFDDALVHLFQPMGAILIDARILERFYREMGKCYRRGDSLNFAEEVAEARRVFENTLNPA